MPERMIVKCPICNQGDIVLFHKEKTFRAKRTRCRAGRSTTNVVSHEKTEVLTEKCPSCGRDRKAIEKALKEGKQPSNDEVLRRLKEAGLDPSRLK